ncbi:polysaccharide biosynthesis protein [Limosilactobacillus coleohominis DSM 14060]|nr:polysaccharide biosynthesis protein [Limosilactobacillus coleohominis DSM 14060]
MFKKYNEKGENMRSGESATDHQAATKSQDAQAKMVTGSAWMTAGSITSRLLGALYVIPWVTWMGAYSTQANALFAKGYNIYSMFLTVATAGIPSAISKLVAHYNGLDQYGVSRRLYHSGMYVSIAMGVICSIVMFLARNVRVNCHGGNLLHCDVLGSGDFSGW